VLSGSVSGYLITPRSTDLPGVRQPVSAEVGLISDSVVQSRFGAAGDDGEFELSAVSGSTYELTLRPEQPGLPFLHESIDLEHDLRLEFDLDAGVAMWGRITFEEGT